MKHATSPFVKKHPNCSKSILIAQVLSISQPRGDSLTLPRTDWVSLFQWNQGIRRNKELLPCHFEKLTASSIIAHKLQRTSEIPQSGFLLCSIWQRKCSAHDYVPENKKPVFTKLPLFAAKEQWGFSNFLLL